MNYELQLPFTGFKLLWTLFLSKMGTASYNGNVSFGQR